MGKENTNIKETLEAWAAITIDRWRQQIQKRDIHIGDLARDLREHVQASADGEIMKVEFFYSWYGKFVDMGVGKGTKIGDVNENRTSRNLEGRHTGNRRRAKPWKSATLFAEVNTLNALLLEKYGRKALAIVEDTVAKTYTIKF